MADRIQDNDAERLPEEAARRLLARASELETVRGAEVSVAELREAAREAGITSGAFEQALAEYRGSDASRPGPPVRRWHVARWWPAVLVLATLLSVLVLRLLFPAA